MTREEAIEKLRKLQMIDRNNKYGEAEEMAIRALEAQPCEDAINRQAVLDRIEESVATYGGQYTMDMLSMWGLFTQFIKEMPSVTPTHIIAKYEFDKDEMRKICDEAVQNVVADMVQKWIPVSDPLSELPRDRILWVTVDDGILSPHVKELYYDMTEWSDITAARNAVAYMEYQKPEPYTESEGEL